MKALCLIVLLGLWATTLHASEVSVKYSEGTYLINANFTVDAHTKDILRVITDFENIAELNPAIIESEVLEATMQDATRVRTVLKDCALFFCKKITRVEQVKVNGTKTLEAEVIPFLSDLREGYTKWEFKPSGEQTQVYYHASIQPKFWIPPWIRSRTVTKKIKKRMLQTIMRLQSLAPEQSL